MIGQLVQQPAGYKAFIPNTFPGALDYAPSVSTSLSNARATLAIGKLDGLTHLVANINFFALMYNLKEAAKAAQLSRQATYGLVKRFVDCGILQPLNPKTRRGVEFIHQEYVEIFID